jgi:hypothetical protein
MSNLVIQLHGDVAHDPCALCGRHTVSGGRPQLVLADTLDVVCRDCGRKHDPSLASLLDLACAAERVSRIGRHTVIPPMAALLDLAHAAENYTSARPQRYRQSA